MKSPPFKITIQHWDEKVSIQRDHSDLTLHEYIEMIRRISYAVGFSASQIKEYINE
jgi:hypothetical protein